MGKLIKLEKWEMGKQGNQREAAKQRKCRHGEMGNSENGEIEKWGTQWKIRDMDKMGDVEKWRIREIEKMGNQEIRELGKQGEQRNGETEKQKGAGNRESRQNGELEKIENRKAGGKWGKGEPRLDSNLRHFGDRWGGADFLKNFGWVAEN